VVAVSLEGWENEGREQLSEGEGLLNYKDGRMKEGSSYQREKDCWTIRMGEWRKGAATRGRSNSSPGLHGKEKEKEEATSGRSIPRMGEEDVEKIPEG
jgi:hypothetical protein